MFPGADNLLFTFHKLVRCETGDQVDITPSNDHQATLLIGLKSKHEGGELIFKESNLEKWSFDDNLKDGAVPWCAFLANTSCSMKPITSGVMAMLQFGVNYNGLKPQQVVKTKYDTLEKDTPGVLNYFGNLEDCDQPADPHMLRHLMRELKKYEISSTKGIALPLGHRYRTHAIVPEHLKRLDRDMFHAFLTAGYKVAMQHAEITLTQANFDETYKFLGVPQGCNVHPYARLFAYYYKDMHGKIVEEFFGANDPCPSVTYIGIGAERAIKDEEKSHKAGYQYCLGRGYFFSGAMVVFE